MGVENDSDRLAVALAEASRLMGAGQWEAAGGAYETIIGDFPDCGAAWFGLGVLGMQIGDNETAVTFFAQAMAVGLSDVACRINIGEAYRRLGLLPLAEEALQEACREAPNARDARLNLAALQAGAGRFTEARENALAATQIDPSYPEGWRTLAEIHRNLRVWDAAADAFATMLALVPEHPDAILGLAEAQRQRKNFVEAINGFQSLLQQDANNLVALTGLGAIAIEQRDYGSAEAMYRKAMEVSPDYREAVFGLGVALLKGGKYEDAEKQLRTVIAMDEANPDSHLQLGEALFALDRYPEAIECYEAVLEREPNSISGLAGIGNVYLHTERILDAVAQYRRAMALAPNMFQLYANLSLAYCDQGQFASAEKYGLKAVELAGDDHDTDLAIQNLAQVQLRRGNLADGWVNYERRVSRRAGNVLPFPAWKGESLLGKRLLIWQDQGLGDVILFGAIYSEIIDEAKTVVIECDRKLVSLIRRSFPKAMVVPNNPRSPHPLARQGIDYHCAGGSLPRIRRSSASNFPRPSKAILKVDKARANYWHDRLAAIDTNLKIGICWRSKLSKGRRDSSYSTLKAWADIFALHGVTLINLQYDQCDLELAEAEALYGCKVIQFRELDMLEDLDETAAMISQLDLVITAPTAVSRMAAGVGTPTMMATLHRDWTGLGQRRDPWMRQLKSYRRRWDQSWLEVFSSIASDLRRRFKLG